MTTTWEEGQSQTHLSDILGVLLETLTSDMGFNALSQLHPFLRQHPQVPCLKEVSRASDHLYNPMCSSLSDFGGSVILSSHLLFSLPSGITHNFFYFCVFLSSNEKRGVFKSDLNIVFVLFI